MRIAVVSDIHSNSVAFEAVLRDIDNKEVDRIFFLGDYIFGGSGSNKTVDLLMDYRAKNSNHIIISGNIDELITPVEENAQWIYPVNKHIYKELGDERVAFLKSLPSSVRIEERGISMLLCHNPSEIEVFTMIDQFKREKNTPNIKGLQELSRSMECDVCIFGHYHLFMDEEVKGKRFICPSSVGMPFNGDPRAQYVILELQDGIIKTTKQFVEYDKLRVVKEFDEKGFFRKYGDWSMKMSTTILTAHNYID